MIPHYLKSISSKQNVFYTWFMAMHTRIDMIVIGHQQENWFCKLSEEIYSQIKEIELIGNCFNPQSELSLLLQKNLYKPHSVSPMLYDILLQCKKYHQLTKGLFDISIDTEEHNKYTLGNLHFHSDNTISFSHILKLNLSGFIKGYALDYVKKILQRHSIENAFISFGNSSVMAIGMKSVNTPWSIRLSEHSMTHLELHNKCLTTSGNNLSNRKHIMNPLTHEYIEGKKTICVLTSTGSIGEVLATTLFISPSLKLSPDLASDCQLFETNG